MKASNKRICAGLLAATLWQAVLAQGINYAPRPAVYAVISVNAAAGTVQLRAADGRTGFVDVPKEVYDLSKVRPGAKIKVDFVAPDKKNKRLTAASVWPA